jgi:uncharacterized protein DUF5667
LRPNEEIPAHADTSADFSGALDRLRARAKATAGRRAEAQLIPLAAHRGRPEPAAPPQRNAEPHAGAVILPIHFEPARPAADSAAGRDGIGGDARRDELAPRRRSRLRASNRKVHARAAVAIVAMVGVLAVSGIAAASEGSAPGDALYGFKRSTERARLAMAGSDVSRGQLSLDFARTRLIEAADMSPSDTTFIEVLNDMDHETQRGCAC